MGSDGAAEQLVEAVADRHELRRVVTGALEEGTDRVRDRDQAPGRPGEGAVDVAERPEQVAVVVVPGRDGRDSEQTGGCAAVDVGVDEMRVDEVGPFRADRAMDVARHARTGVEAAPDGAVRDAQPVELLVETREVGSGNVEAEEASVDAALAQRGQQCEQVPLGAADPGELVQVEDLHRSRRS